MDKNYRLLAAAVILQAARDSRNGIYKSDVEHFLSSKWFETLAISIGLDPARVRNMLLQEFAGTSRLVPKEFRP